MSDFELAAEAMNGLAAVLAALRAVVTGEAPAEQATQTLLAHAVRSAELASATFYLSAERGRWRRISLSAMGAQPEQSSTGDDLIESLFAEAQPILLAEEGDFERLAPALGWTEPCKALLLAFDATPTRRALLVLTAAGAQPDPERWRTFARAFSVALAEIVRAGLRDAEIRSAEAREKDLFRAAVEAAPNGMLVVDEGGQIILVNQRLARMFGYEGDDLVGQALELLLPAAMRGAHRSHRKRFEADPAIRHIGARPTLAGLHKDGREIPVEVGLNPLPRDGARFVLASVVDLTERQRLEQQLRQAQKMEAIGQLAGGVAHDFNNLLTVIGGNAELLAATLGAQDERQSDVGDIVEASRRAAELTRQLLAFSRRQVLARRVLDPVALLKGTERLLRRLIGADIDLICRFDSDTGKILADASQLEQVVLNLAINARDAMPTGGVLTLETSVAELDAESASVHDVAPGRYAVITVTDTGIGMTQEVQLRIFEPFFTTKEPGRGTGLGLATVYGIVRQSGGHIWVYSELGRGAAFRVYLPQVDASAHHQPVTPDPGVLGGGGERILLVEDDEAVRRFALRALERQGYEVIDAPSGAEALHRFRELGAHVDLLVTDIVMPDMDGLTLAERLLAEQPGLPVLYTSGYAPEAIGRLEARGADLALLRKPYSAVGLARAVRHALDTPEDS